MAKYYYCNATTKSGLPCKMPVKVESERCPWHKSPPGGNPQSGRRILLQETKKWIDRAILAYGVVEIVTAIHAAAEKFVPHLLRFLQWNSAVWKAETTESGLHSLIRIQTELESSAVLVEALFDVSSDEAFLELITVYQIAAEAEKACAVQGETEKRQYPGSLSAG